MKQDSKYSAYIEQLGEGRRFLLYSAAALLVQIALILPFLFVYSHIRSIPRPIRIDLYSTKLDLSDPIQTLTTYMSVVHQKDYDRYFAAMTPESKASIENVLTKVNWSIDQFTDWQYHSLKPIQIEVYGTAQLDDVVMLFETIHTLYSGNWHVMFRVEKINDQWYCTHRLAGDPRYQEWAIEWLNKGEGSKVINRLLEKE